MFSFQVYIGSRGVVNLTGALPGMGLEGTGVLRVEWTSNHRWAPRVEEHGRARRGETGGRNPVNPARLDTTESSSPMKSVESSKAWI